MLKLTTIAMVILVCAGGAALAADTDALLFGHPLHADEDLNSADCHQWNQGQASGRGPMPDRRFCLECHEDDDLPAMPNYPASHLENFRFAHQFSARNQGDDCAICHRESESCPVCHHGEKVDFIAHDRNWAYNHPLTYYKGTEDCQGCHEPRSFCTDCHQDNGVRPANHFYGEWISPVFHGEEAKIDLERSLCARPFGTTSHGKCRTTCTVPSASPRKGRRLRLVVADRSQTVGPRLA